MTEPQTTQTCKTCSTPFPIAPEDEAFYAKLGIPAPTLCPPCRKQRLLSWRAERKYYPRTCDLCKKSIISVHHKDNPYPVYCSKCWWSDKWDATDFSQEIDFTKPFFPQFAELQTKVPQIAMMNDNNTQSENCEYCQDFAFGKDCHLVTGSWRTRDCYYSNNINHGQDLVDCSSVNLQCELCYECISCQHIYGCSYLQSSSNCNNCHFGFDLKGCSDCFGCIALRQKKYHIFNEPYTKKEYETLINSEKFNLGSHETTEKLKKRFAEFILPHPRKCVNQVRCQDCHGNDNFNCKEVYGFDNFNAEHCKFFEKGDHPLYCYDVYQSGNAQWCCECVTSDDSYMTCYSTWCWKDKNVEYSDNCHTSENLFACIGLRHHRHCILNRQYSPEEYERLRALLVAHMTSTGEWGEFFPMHLSSFAYNETVAQDYFPLTKEQALAQNLKWRDPDKKEFKPQTHDIPDHLKDVPDSITEETLACTDCGKNFRIIPQELKFYRRTNHGVPRKCPDCRHLDRFGLKAPSNLYNRTCTKCSAQIETVYSPDRPEVVYCEECYIKEFN